MELQENYSLLPHNTFHLEARARWFAEYDSVESLQTLLAHPVVRRGPLLHVGEGSNLLFCNDFDGVVLHSAIRFVRTEEENADTVRVEAGAGLHWDDFVAHCVARGWGGSENLSYIPGEVGAAAVQNIGAYGAEVQEIIREVRCLSAETGQPAVFPAEACGYGYRDSIFKREGKGAFIVTSVLFELQKRPVFKLRYGNLKEAAERLGPLSLSTVREAVVAVRREKLPDPEVTGSAGSFFMNPVIAVAQYEALRLRYPQIPGYYDGDGGVKVPAGWLIEQCGWKGKSEGGAAVHDRQALVIVNRTGRATAGEIETLARRIADSVSERFGVVIRPEVNYIR